MKQKTLTMQSLYKEAVKQLEDAQIGDAGIDAWYLFEYIFGVTKMDYYMEPSQEMPEEKVREYREAVSLRARKIPLQHITHEQYFMGYPFYVNENVLVPRQDTETLVEEALKVMRDGIRVLDLCTGSGCILISLIKMYAEKHHESAAISGLGADISEKALEVAEKNAEALQVPAEFVQSDLFSNISDEKKYDLIVSNPPYIRTSVINELEEEVKCHDPFIALDGKEDGLFFYRKIVDQSRAYIREGGWLMFEIGYDQGKAVKELMENAGYTHVSVKKDLASLDRVVIGMYNER